MLNNVSTICSGWPLYVKHTNTTITNNTKQATVPPYYTTNNDGVDWSLDILEPSLANYMLKVGCGQDVILFVYQSSKHNALLLAEPLASLCLFGQLIAKT